MIKRTIILSIAFFSLAFLPGENDVELLRSIFRTIGERSSALKPDQTFYMSYSLHTVNADSSEKQPDVTIELWTSGNLIEIKSKQMQVYQDEKEAFVVLPSKRMLMRNDAPRVKKGETAWNRSLALYDSLLLYSKVSSSTKVKAKDHDKRISIEINEKGKELFNGVYKADYWVNSSDKTIKKIRIYYSAEGSLYDGQISCIDYTFHKMDFNCKGKKLSSNVASSFVKGNQLNGNYKGYKLIDNRAVANDQQD